MKDLSFSDLRDANVKRCETHYHAVEAFSLMDWLGCVTGELGEAAGVIKNLRRRQVEGEREDHPIPPSDLGELADELADTVIYLDLLAARAGIDLGEAIRVKFNRVSRERLKCEVLL